jgi:cytochrome d ubiquinol oxidase subunit II
VNILAFCVLGVLLVGYVLLDGYDLGMGAVLLFVSRSEEERRAALASIAPFWNGNEVWLIAAGAALFAFFPQVYASAFSGFYLPFMVVLWLLMGRGIAFEIREMVEHPLWHGFWDAVFAVSSTLLIVLFGVALANIIRGVPLDSDHYFVGSFAFLLNPYALAVAVLAVLALAQHGGTYLLMRTGGGTAQRTRRALTVLFPAVVAGYAIVTVATFLVRPASTFGPQPVIAVGWLIAVAGLTAVRVSVVRSCYQTAFLASSAFLAGMLLSAAATIFPYLLPGYPTPSSGLDIYRSAPPPASLTSALTAVILGLVLLAGYRTFVARRLSGTRG